jgi:hypothetical protein
VEIVALRHVVTGPAHPVRFAPERSSARRGGHDTNVHGATGGRLSGGDVVALRGATLRVTAGWSGVPHTSGGWLLERDSG